MPFLAMQFWLIAVFVFALGAVVGSFLNVVILRLPGGNSIIFPASRCPKCAAPIRWFDNIPIASFILLRRRCRYCHALIAWQYPAVEALMGFLAVALLSAENLEKLLSPKQLAGWGFIQSSVEASPREISRGTDVARPTINQALEKLLKLKKIERIGLGRSTRYRPIKY